MVQNIYKISDSIEFDVLPRDIIFINKEYTFWQLLRRILPDKVHFGGNNHHINGKSVIMKIVQKESYNFDSYAGSFLCERVNFLNTTLLENIEPQGKRNDVLEDCLLNR